eukprot:1442662-Pleurochrysis_carterae.AAC.2
MKQLNMCYQPVASVPLRPPFGLLPAGRRIDSFAQPSICVDFVDKALCENSPYLEAAQVNAPLEMHLLRELSLATLGGYVRPVANLRCVHSMTACMSLKVKLALVNLASSLLSHLLHRER